VAAKGIFFVAVNAMIIPSLTDEALSASPRSSTGSAAAAHAGVQSEQSSCIFHLKDATMCGCSTETFAGSIG
jgi:hypothetical protein